MKHLKLVVLVAFLAIGLGANAQKVAHINTDKLLSEMPQTKALKAELQRLEKTYKNDIEAMAKKLQAKMTKYQKEGATQSQEINEKRAMEVQQEGARIQKARQEAAVAMQKKYQEKTMPILQKAEKAIKEVASEKGIIYVLDASPGKGLIVYDKGEDLYNAVKAKLGF
ncbi:MAG: hypothetical protein CR961_01900 [Polaribacter sp.]|nr:MAG: hypothetical protein CR961_01900 [Polaribacter sp.]